MTRAGEKLIAAAKEAAKAARCRHKWDRVSMKVHGGKIINKVEVCDKCGVRRWTWTSKPSGTR